MRPIARWNALLASTATVADRTGVDGYGVPTYGTATSYRAHLSRERRLVRNAQGQEVVSEQRVYLATGATILPTARVTLSTGDVGSTEQWAIQPVILAIERRFDEVGAHHTVVHFQ